MEHSKICKEVHMLLEQICKHGETKHVSFEEDITVFLDSLMFVLLIVEIENKFGIEINDDDFDLSKMTSINDISSLIGTYLHEIK